MYILEVYPEGNYYIYTTHKRYDYLYSFSLSFRFSIPFSPKLAPFPPLHYFLTFPYFHLTTTSAPYVQTEAKYSIFCSSAYAIGAIRADIHYAGGWSTSSTVLEAKYIDFTMRSSLAAWIFFDYLYIGTPREDR